MVLTQEEFKKIAVWLIVGLTTKGTNRAIEFATKIKGEPLDIRSHCPMNYRSIWYHMSPAMAKSYHRDLWDEKAWFNGWYQRISHDSCWQDGIVPQGLAWEDRASRHPLR